MTMTKSSQPRKQRLAIYTAPMHVRQKLVAAHLDKKLRKEYGRRSLALRKGDRVEVMRGDFSGMKGSVKAVNLKALTVTIDGINRKKANGSEVAVPMKPSNLRIIEAVMEDKMRRKIVERSGGKVTVVKKEEKKEVKETKKAEEHAFKCSTCGSGFDGHDELNKHTSEKHKEFMVS